MTSTLTEDITVTPMSKFKAVLALTRWREHVPYTIPCVAGGAMMAIHQTNGTPDLRLIAIVLANILAQSFAFMINDVADAPDDALNVKKKARNVISNGTLTPTEGMIWTWGTFLVALGLFALGGTLTFFLGLLQLVLCYLYSAHPFRWKARLVTDVLSHALMLSALLVMTGYFTYSNEINQSAFMFACAFFFSAYGQFFNQLDDYDVDKEAGLRNTVVVLGKNGTKLLMYTCAIIAVICACLAILTGVFPNWLASIALIAIFTCSLFIWETDMRGNKADGSGVIQKPGLLMLNIVVLTWLAQSIGFLQF